MKKFIFLVLLIPVLTFCHDSQKMTSEKENELKKSAELLVTNYIKGFENKNWNEMLNSVSEKGLQISTLETSLIRYSLIGYSEYVNKTKLEKKVLIDSLSTKIIGKTTAMVTAWYKTTTINSWGIGINGNLDIFVLEKNEDNWKIQSYYPQISFPTIFNKNIESVWNYKHDVLCRFSDAISQMGNICLYFLEDYKKNGTSLAQTGKIMGKRFAQGWNPSRGFDGLVSGFTNVIQSISTNVEVLELNKNTAIIKYDPSFKPMAKYYNISEKELLDFFQSSFGEIADHMGGICTIKENGTFYELTLTKK